MEYSFYIIKQNSPESKLLSYAGFERCKLQVIKWKGRKQIYGGFGKTPIEWRISGTDNVEVLCNTIIRILGARKILSPLEIKALERAKTTVNGINKAKLVSQKDIDLRELRKITISSYLKYKYPSLSINNINVLINSLSVRNFNSIIEMIQVANMELIELKSIEEARKLFCAVMKDENETNS